MNSKSLLLYKTMSASTSRFNIIKHSHDKKKKNTALAAIIGYGVLGVFAAGLSGLMGYGLAIAGVPRLVPNMIATIISLLALILTLFKSNSYLYSFKEYDMLMAMPFSIRTIVSDRFLLMYIRDVVWDLVISYSALIGYSIAVRPSVVVIIFWIVLTPFISLMPMVVSSLLGVIVAHVASRVKHKTLIQTVLTFIIIIPLFFIRPVIEHFVRSGQAKELLDMSYNTMSGVSKVVPSIGWFENAVNKADVLSFILMIVVSLALYIGLVLIISATYRRINSSLKTISVKHKTKVGSNSYKPRTQIGSVVYKEYKRISGSSMCTVNLGIGAIMCILVGIVLPFLNVNDILYIMSKGEAVNVDLAPFRILWPICIYFFTGMMPTTISSFSLEGKNFWIIKSLPFDIMNIVKGKMLLNIYLNLIPGIFATIMGFVAVRAPWYEYIIGIVMFTAMTLFSTTYGMFCGIKHMKLDWENEMEVVKKGVAGTLYVLPNMFGTFIMFGLLLVCGLFLNGLIVAGAITLLYLGLALVFNIQVKKEAKKI